MNNRLLRWSLLLVVGFASLVTFAPGVGKLVGSLFVGGCLFALLLIVVAFCAFVLWLLRRLWSRS